MKSGHDEIVLPQAFLTVSKDEKVIERSFLGHYSTVQYLEDCGIIAKVLAGDLCAHYRSFNGFIFYSWCRPLDKLDSKAEMCSSCYLKTEV